MSILQPEGYTPLMYAANLGLVENVEALLTMAPTQRARPEAV